MPAVQRTPPTGVFSLPAVEKNLTQGVLPIIAVNSTAITPLAVSGRRGVKHIASCLSDYYIQNNKGTTTHRLINICEHTTHTNIVSGYVDVKCSVSSPKNNPLNLFSLNKQGDLYSVETKNTNDCTQAIQAENLPFKLGDCLYDFRTSYDKYTFENKLINACKDSVVQGYVDRDCQVTFNTANPLARFRLNPSETIAIKTDKFCEVGVHEGAPPIKIGACLQNFVTSNSNGTATHKIINACYSDNYAYVRKGCVINASLNNEWNHFRLAKNAEISLLMHDKEDCDAPIRYGDPPVISYEKLYCPTNNASLAGLPRAEKIVAGEGLLSQDARHLVYVRNRDSKTYCSGSLLSDRHVLTAAHCMIKDRNSKQSAPLESLRVLHDPFPSMKKTQYVPSTEYKVKAGFIAPCYVNTQEDNCDLALLKLEKPIVNGQVISLPTNEDFCEFAKEVDRVLVTDRAFPNELSGKYDKTQTVWQEGNALAQGFGYERDAKGKIVNLGRAKQGKVVAYKIASSGNGVISIRPSNNGDNICAGDSGGPLLLKTDERKVQVGVTCCFTDGNSGQCTGGASYTNLHNKMHRKWLSERMTERARAIKITPRDYTRLRFSPDTCVEKSDVPDGFFSQLKSLSSSYYWRTTTFINKCHHKNHPATVNIKFYSNQNNQESVAAENTIQLTLGETKVFSTYGSALKTDLTWEDLDN